MDVDNTQGEPEVPIANPPGVIAENPPIISELLPERVFATDRYPQDGRINSYSRPEYLLDIVDILQDTEEFHTIKNSPLGPLFDLPVRKSSLSGKLVHNILCRSLHTAKRHEMWFVFGGMPFRFSLREFALVTGLPCGPYPAPEIIRAAQKPKDGEKKYWETLFGENTKVMSILEIVNILRRDQRLPPKDKMKGWKRLRLCLIVIVEGILICNSQPVRASEEVVEMVKDLESFFSYPWGRESFLLTLRMVKVGTKIGTVGELVEKLMQSHAATHGFMLSLQLLVLQAIPLLDYYLPDTDDEQTFTDRSIIQLSKLKTFHNANIIEAENHPDLVVYPIIDSDRIDGVDYSWADEEPDPGVNYIISLINRGFKFTKAVWLGGYDGMQLIPIPTQKNPRKFKNGTKAGKKVLEKKCVVEEPGSSSSLSTFQIVESRLFDHKQEIRQLIATERAAIKAEVLAEVLQRLTDSGILMANHKTIDDLTQRPVDNNTVDNVAGDTHTNLLKRVNNSFWDDYIGVPDVLNSLKSPVGDQPGMDRNVAFEKPDFTVTERIVDETNFVLAPDKTFFEFVHGEGSKKTVNDDDISQSSESVPEEEDAESIPVDVRSQELPRGQVSKDAPPNLVNAERSPDEESARDSVGKDISEKMETNQSADEDDNNAEDSETYDVMDPKNSVDHSGDDEENDEQKVDVINDMDEKTAVNETNLVDGNKRVDENISTGKVLSTEESNKDAPRDSVGTDISEKMGNNNSDDEDENTAQNSETYDSMDDKNAMDANDNDDVEEIQIVEDKVDENEDMDNKAVVDESNIVDENKLEDESNSTGKVLSTEGVEGVEELSESDMDDNMSTPNGKNGRKRNNPSNKLNVQEKRVRRAPSRFGSTPDQEGFKRGDDIYCSFRNIELFLVHNLSCPQSCCLSTFSKSNDHLHRLLLPRRPLPPEKRYHRHRMDNRAIKFLRI